MLVFQPCRFCGSPREKRDCVFCDRASRQRRRAREYGVENTLTAGEIYNLYVASQGVCYYCEKPITGEWTLDHLTPMVRGGGNTLKNVVIACMPCNGGKGSSKSAAYYKLTKTMSQFRASRAIMEQTVASMNGDWFSVRQFEEKARLLLGRPIEIRYFEFFLRSWIRKTEFERQAVHNPDDYNFDCLYRVKSSKRKAEPALINAIKPLLPRPPRKRISKNN